MASLKLCYSYLVFKILCISIAFIPYKSSRGTRQTLLETKDGENTWGPQLGSNSTKLSASWRYGIY
ncbi:hypothetical protein YC2023_113589 [Brassica napus]